MKNIQPECVGKVFVAVRGMRRCLICDGIFTPREAANHAMTLLSTDEIRTGRSVH